MIQKIYIKWQDIHYISLDEKSQAHTEQLMLYNLGCCKFMCMHFIFILKEKEPYNSDV